MREKDIENATRLRWTKEGRGRLFRNVVTSATVGNGQHIRCGLCVGSSDLIGWTTRTIRPEDVGKKVAVFTAAEIKTKTGRLSPAQKRFLEAVSKAGGVALVVRGDDETRCVKTDLFAENTDLWLVSS